MRYLGIDYGAKRVGLARSDENGKIAMPFKTLAGNKEIVPALKALVEKEKIGKIVVGIPVPFSGGESKQALEIKKFAALLKKEVGIPVDFENEVLTSKMAGRSGARPEHIDMAAAAIILQSYLDKHNSRT